MSKWILYTFNEFFWELFMSEKAISPPAFLYTVAEKGQYFSNLIVSHASHLYALFTPLEGVCFFGLLFLL